MDARRLCTDYIKPSIVNRCGRPGLAGCCGSNAGSGSNAGTGGTAADDGSSGAGLAAAALPESNPPGGYFIDPLALVKENVWFLT